MTNENKERDPWSEEPDVSDPELKQFTDVMGEHDPQPEPIGEFPLVSGGESAEITMSMPNEATAARIQFAFACGLEHVMREQNDVTAADIVRAFIDSFKMMTAHYTVKESVAAVAHANRTSILQELDILRAEIVALELPTIVRLH